MHFEQERIGGEDFVGLLGLATDKYALLARNFRSSKSLGVPILKTSIYGTGLIGMFCAGNSNGLLLPYFVSDIEIKKIKEFLSGLDVRIARIDDLYTAIGNLVACNDKAAVVSPKLSDTKVIKDTLDTEIIKTKIAGHEEVGACCVVTNRGMLLHPDAEFQLDELKKTLGVNGAVGTVNLGVPFVKSGVIANSHGYITGRRTTGIELGTIDEALGFI